MNCHILKGNEGIRVFEWTTPEFQWLLWDMSCNWHLCWHVASLPDLHSMTRRGTARAQHERMFKRQRHLPLFSMSGTIQEAVLAIDSRERHSREPALQLVARDGSIVRPHFLRMTPEAMSVTGGALCDVVRDGPAVVLLRAGSGMGSAVSMHPPAWCLR